MAACSTTLRKSRERSESIEGWSVVRGTADRRQLAPGRTIGPEPEDVVGLHHLVDLAGAFVDHRPLAVAIEPADRILVGVAVGAVDLHGIPGGALGCHRGEPFREPGFPGITPAAILQEAGAEPQQARRLIVGL